MAEPPRQAGLVIVGAGGHAKVAIAAAECAGHGIAAVLDDDPRKAGSILLGYAVTAPPPPPWPAACEDFVHVAIGDNGARQRKCAGLNARWQTIVHPAAFVHRSAKIGPGTLICAGAVIQPDAEIGAHCIVNSGAVIEHDCRIGDFCHIAPQAALTGGVEIGEGVFIGAGATLIPGIRVGTWAVVGAGAVVTRDVSSNVTVVGMPARPRD